jgi:hypothetical protein
MKKFYHIYQVIDGEIIDGITYPTSEEFKEKAFSEHSAVEWISAHLKNKKHKNNKYTIKAIYEKLNG